MYEKGSLHFRKITTALMSIMIAWDLYEEWILGDHLEVVLSLGEAWGIYGKTCSKAVVVNMLRWSQLKRSKNDIVIPTPCRIKQRETSTKLRQKCLKNSIRVAARMKIVNPVSTNELIHLGFGIRIVRQGQQLLKLGRCAAKPEAYMEPTPDLLPRPNIIPTLGINGIFEMSLSYPPVFRCSRYKNPCIRSTTRCNEYLQLKLLW